MKIHVITSENLLVGLDVARILGADVALAEKPGGITAAYILTTEGDDFMKQTKLRKHKSEDASADFYPVPFNLDSAKAFLESKFAVEYILGEDEEEEAISLTVRKILASAIAAHDLEWFARWPMAASLALGVDIKRIDLMFMERVHTMRNNSVISATPKEVREMAEEIVMKHPRADWDRLASEKGHSLLTQTA